MRGCLHRPDIDRVDGFHFCGAGGERLPHIGRVEHLPLVGGPGELVQVPPDRPQLLARPDEFGLLGGEVIRAAGDEFTDETPQNPGRVTPKTAARSDNRCHSAGYRRTLH